MVRVFRLTTNLGLAVVSVWVAFVLLQLLDATARPFLKEPEWPSPYVGLIFSPNQVDEHEMLNFSCTYRINALGFRDREFAPQKSTHIRALAIGDSFTYGWGVNLEDAWCKRLEANLRRQGIDIEILNMGKPGAGPRDYYRIAECAVPRLKPDLVIVCVTQTEDALSMSGTGDFDSFLKDHFKNLIQLIRYHGFQRMPRCAAGTAGIEQTRKSYADNARNAVAEMSDEERKRLDALEPRVKAAFFDGMLNPWQIAGGIKHPEDWRESLSPPDMPLRISRIADRFRRIRILAQENSAEVVVVCIPNGFHVNRESLANWQRMGFRMDPALLTSNGPDNAIAESCRRAGITAFHTVTDEFRKRIDEKGLYYELDQHMTPAGQGLFAELITPMIAEDIRKDAKHNPALASGLPRDTR